MSQRHEDDPLLDAARACVDAVGVRRTTLTDIARRAGVSRMTVYRRFPDVATLIQALMTREFSAAISGAARSGETDRARLVSGVIDGAERLAGHGLFRRILDVDPELILPYVVQRYGAFQQLVLDTLTAELRASRDGSIRPGDPAVMAASIELLLRGCVVGALAEAPPGGRPAVLAEITRTLERGLTP